ncbi:clathrin associated protein complex large subunit [Dimargaris verticillata]|uniref:AP-1 complex subunit gamma n=1 Tax=Dimargaris verticillata TaxID=2761393 RepID=A0A9W8BD30_9FUNG|nr:clathrin associated protein complex large subunit [Dimargaris verticillata]
MSFLRPRDLIRAVRCCKTAADERSVIQRESAGIRTSFKEVNSMDARYTNIGKLLYIYLLGYPAHFGQIECLKLVASGRYSDKRLGYLGIMLLLDENQEILTLITNSLKNDLNHSNMYIVGLALCTLGNIASAEVATDLVDEVERLMETSNSYIRKKAALCAVRIVRKVPELLDSFVEKTKHHLSEKNHGVLLSGLALAIELCEHSSEALVQYRALVPNLVRQLKTLLTAGFSPEHDVAGIADPFIQVKILRLLRILGRGDAISSELMNDILTQVATNTDAAKNVGMAILYETAVTVLDIQSDTSLRVLAINILGKFLANRDNNIRYVALSTLTRAMATESAAVQRHRNTILECLHDVDISIRRRALHLAFALIQPSNVRMMVRELLSFLEVADAEFKPGMTANICAAAERFAPSRRWQVDTVIRVFQTAGNFVKEENVDNFLALVANQPDLQPFVVQKLYIHMQKDLAQTALVQTGVWALGEYGDYLWQSPGVASPEGQADAELEQCNAKPTEIITLLDNIMQLPYVTVTTRQMVLTALIKLSDRLQSSSSTVKDGDALDALGLGSTASAPSPATPVAQIQGILKQHAASVHVELQQRAVEYSNLFCSEFDESRGAILERMPVPKYHPEATVAAGDLLLGGGAQGGQVGIATQSVPGASSAGSSGSLLMDLMDDAGPSATGALSGSTLAITAGPSSQPSATVDLLADIFGDTSLSQNTTPTVSSAVVSPASVAAINSQGDLFDLLGQPAPASSAGVPPAPEATASYEAYNQHGLCITLYPIKDPAQPQSVLISVRFHNQSATDTVRNLLLQIAVPKSQKLHMQPPSATELGPGQEAMQSIRVHNPSQSAVRLRLKIVFGTSGGQQIDEIVQFAGFPPTLV